MSMIGPKPLSFFLTLALGCAFFTGYMPLWIACILLLSIVCIFFSEKYTTLSRLNQFLILGLGAYLYSKLLGPGFEIAIFSNVQITPDAIPYNMGIWIPTVFFSFWVFLTYTDKPIEKMTKKAPPAKWFLYSYLAVVGVLILPALLSGYVRIDPKIPSILFPWILHNLFIVCICEEAFFRRFLLGQGVAVLNPQSALAKKALLIIISIFFGLSHYKSGPIMIGLASVAGIFYGLAYLRSGTLYTSILVHFFLNLTHLIFFTYPSLKM